MNRRLRVAGSFVLVGLMVELASLLWSHPLAFILFIMPGGLLIVIGILLYLYSLVSRGTVASPDEPAA